MSRDTESGLWKSCTTYVAAAGDDGKQWACKFCTLTFKGGLNGLVAHLARVSGGGIRVCTSDEPLPAKAQKLLDAEMAKSSKKRKAVADTKARTEARKAASTSLSQACIPFGSTTATAREQADMAAVKMICAGALSFRLLDSPEFTEFIRLVHKAGAGYTAPCRQTAASTLLDKAVAEIDVRVKVPLLEEQRLYGSTIMSDGITDKRKHPLLNLLITTPKHVHVVGIEDTSGHSKTTEYISGLMSEHITRDVDMATMDGACASSLAALEKEHPWLSAVLCGTHSISLIITDVAKNSYWWEDIFKQGTRLAKFFRSHHATAALLRKYSTKTLLLPADTRFAGKVIMLLRILELKDSLRKVVTDDSWSTFRAKQTVDKRRNIIDPLYHLIIGLDFWDSLIAATKLTAPMFKVLRMLDGETPAIAKLIPAYRGMLDEINAVLSDKNICGTDDDVQEAGGVLLDTCLARWKYLRHPLYSAAYALNPQFTKTALLQIDDDDKSVHIDYSGDLHLILQRYLADDEEHLAAALIEYAGFRKRTGVADIFWQVSHGACYSKRTASAASKYALPVLLVGAAFRSVS